MAFCTAVLTHHVFSIQTGTSHFPCRGPASPSAIFMPRCDAQGLISNSPGRLVWSLCFPSSQSLPLTRLSHGMLTHVCCVSSLGPCASPLHPDPQHMQVREKSWLYREYAGVCRGGNRCRWSHPLIGVIRLRSKCVVPSVMALWTSIMVKERQ